MNVWTTPTAPPARRANYSWTVEAAVLMTLKLPQKFQLKVLQTQQQLKQQELEVSSLGAFYVIVIFYL